MDKRRYNKWTVEERKLFAVLMEQKKGDDWNDWKAYAEVIGTKTPR